MSIRHLVFVLCLVFTMVFANSLQVDTQNSSVKWTGYKVVGQHSGTMAFKEGKLDVKGSKITGGYFVVDMNSLLDQDLTGDSKLQNMLQGHLKSADFFNVEKFPTATFRVTSFVKKSDTEVVLAGEMTIIGVTNRIEVPVKGIKTKTGYEGQAKITIDRTKYGLKYGSGKFFSNLGDKVIKDDFDLELKVVLK